MSVVVGSVLTTGGVSGSVVSEADPGLDPGGMIVSVSVVLDLGSSLELGAVVFGSAGVVVDVSGLDPVVSVVLSGSGVPGLDLGGVFEPKPDAPIWLRLAG